MSEQAKAKRTKPGKEQYKFQQSYRRSSCCGQFFFVYANRVVEAIGANKGKLKYEDVEDLKADDEETDRLA